MTSDSQFNQLATAAPLLSKTQEVSLARKIDITRATWQHVILTDWHGSQSVLDLLTNVLDGYDRLDSVIALDRQDPAVTRQDIMTRIRGVVDSCEAIRDRIEHLSQFDDTASRKAVYRSYRNIAKLIKGLGMRSDAMEKCCAILRYPSKETAKGAIALEQYRDAKKLMTESNLRLVISVAMGYRDRGCDVADLVQEGSLGLMKAVDKFDHRRGTSFATLASWWIRQSIAKLASESGRLIRLPVHIIEAQSSVSRAAKSIEQGTCKTATEEEIAEVARMPVDKVKAAMGCRVSVSSLDKPVSTETGEACVGDFFVDPSAADPLQAASGSLLSDRLESVFATLDSRECDIVRMRFGIGLKAPLTLVEIGDVLGVTRERVRQLLGRAMRKLQHPARMKSLAGFLDRKLDSDA
jgi:RNA polymerase primary sigma factor